ncbi:MAG: hypothetical protein NTX36_15065 [Proteobacteria bacterium]|nr:hypothetical protein [Pseudomonadota bacterium]
MERLKKVELLPTFSNIVGEVLNIIDGPMIYNALKSTNNLLKGTENGSED